MGRGVSCKLVAHPTDYRLGFTEWVRSDKDVSYPAALFLFTSGLV